MDKCRFMNFCKANKLSCFQVDGITDCSGLQESCNVKPALDLQRAKVLAVIEGLKEKHERQFNMCKGCNWEKVLQELIEALNKEIYDEM